MSDFVRAHRKGILVAITAILVIFLAADQAKEISAGIGAILTVVVPNDEEAIKRVYHRKRRKRGSR